MISLCVAEPEGRGVTPRADGRCEAGCSRRVPSCASSACFPCTLRYGTRRGPILLHRLHLCSRGSPTRHYPSPLVTRRTARHATNDNRHNQKPYGAVGLSQSQSPAPLSSAPRVPLWNPAQSRPSPTYIIRTTSLCVRHVHRARPHTHQILSTSYATHVIRQGRLS